MAMKRKSRVQLSAVILCGLMSISAAAQTQDGETSRMRIVDVVVASPRTAMVPVPFPDTADIQNTPCDAVGAAWNFARKSMAVRMKLGGVLRTRLSDNMEGIWYPRACGKLGTLLVLEMKDTSSGGDDWIELGRDGIADHRCGPSMGRARVRVLYRPERLGEYHLRASIISYAIPSRSDAVDVPDLASVRDVVVRDQVHIRLRVTGQPVAEPLPYEEPSSEMPEELLADY